MIQHNDKIKFIEKVVRTLMGNDNIPVTVPNVLNALTRITGVQYALMRDYVYIVHEKGYLTEVIKQVNLYQVEFAKQDSALIDYVFEKFGGKNENN